MHSDICNKLINLSRKITKSPGRPIQSTLIRKQRQDISRFRHLSQSIKTFQTRDLPLFGKVNFVIIEVWENNIVFIKPSPRSKVVCLHTNQIGLFNHLDIVTEDNKNNKVIPHPKKQLSDEDNCSGVTPIPFHIPFLWTKV
jgi:hypothetical protein